MKAESCFDLKFETNEMHGTHENSRNHEVGWLHDTGRFNSQRTMKTQGARHDIRTLYRPIENFENFQFSFCIGLECEKIARFNSSLENV
jgi:hypothetical protein